MDAQRLEGAGSGMNGKAQRGGALRFRHDGGELRRAGDRARRDDGGGDAASVLLFAETGDDRSQRGMIGAVDEIGGAHAGQAHAHIQRAILAEGEAAFWLVELEGRDAEIEHDAIGL